MKFPEYYVSINRPSDLSVANNSIPLKIKSNQIEFICQDKYRKQ